MILRLFGGVGGVGVVLPSSLRNRLTFAIAGG